MLSRAKLLMTPWTAAHPAPLSMRFFRQGYWSGLPFPAPGDLSNPGIKPRSPALQAESLPSEPPGKPKNIGVGCHSLLQGIFPTQGSNLGLLHCRQILYHLSHQGSPPSIEEVNELKVIEQQFINLHHPACTFWYGMYAFN